MQDYFLAIPTLLPFHYRGLTPEEEGQVTGTQDAKLSESIIKRTVPVESAYPNVDLRAWSRSQSHALGWETLSEQSLSCPLRLRR